MSPEAQVPVTPVPAERDEDARRLFLRQTRDAVHHVIWYLGALRPTDSAEFNTKIQAAAEWRVRQAQRMLKCIEVPKAALTRKQVASWKRVCGALLRIVDDDAQAGADASTDAKAGEEAKLVGDETPDGEASAEDSSDATALARADLDEVHEALAACDQYLRDSMSLYEGRWLVHGVPTVWRWVRLHAAAVINLVVAIGLSVGLPQLWGLFVEAWPSTLIFATLLSGSMLLPAWLGHRHVRDEGRSKTYDVFGATFRSIRYQPKPPPRRVPRYTERDPIVEVLRQSITLRMLGFTGGLVVIALGALAVNLVVPGTLALTVFGSLALFYVTGVIAYGLDYWAFIDGRPIRALFLLGFALSALLLDDPDSTVPLMLLLAGLALAMGAASVRAAMDDDFANRNAFIAFCAIFVVGLTFAASSHINRVREAWTDEGHVTAVERVPTTAWPWTLEGRADPVVLMVASGGGSRAAIFTTLTLEAMHRDTPEVACNLQAIGSVSGGSLANAIYTKRRWYDQNDICDPIRSVDTRQWTEAASGDFIWPTIEGAIPGKSRGLTLQEEWERGPTRFGLTTVEDIAGRYNRQHRRGPLPLFHTANLERHAVVISPLEAAAFTQTRRHEMAEQHNAYDPLRDATWVHYRDAIYGLDTLLLRRPTKLSEAVRASANFPYGFPLVEVVPTGPMLFSPDRDRRRQRHRRRDPGLRMLLTDGGTLSNSGMWAMYRLIRNHTRELRARGVVLVIVEASHMPAYEVPGRFSSVASLIGDQRPIAQSLHRIMLDELHTRLGGRLEVVQVDLRASGDDNVETSWALPQRRIDDLESLFEESWGTGPRGRANELRRKFVALRDSASTVVDVAPEPPPPLWRRPPVD